MRCWLPLNKAKGNLEIPTTYDTPSIYYIQVFTTLSNLCDGIFYMKSDRVLNMPLVFTINFTYTLTNA